jgi:HSP20 family molecular chaperone IbpA
MTEAPDDYNELMDILHKIIVSHVTGSETDRIIGVKFVMNGGTIHLASARPRTIPIEMFEDEGTITVQTSLPPECPDDFFIAYQDGKLQLNTGKNREYSAVIPVADIDPSLTETYLKNGVLEITCVKKVSGSGE